MKPRVDKIIIVEGRNDESAVKAAVDAEVIVTSGFSIKDTTWDLIEKAYRGPGIIVFTDPDYAGENIRRRIKARFPESLQAHLTKEEAKKKSDIGIENASAQSIISALGQSVRPDEKAESLFSMKDLLYFDLAGSAKASFNRERMGKELGIGTCNVKTFLARLNSYGIDREEYYQRGQALFTGSDK